MVQRDGQAYRRLISESIFELCITHDSIRIKSRFKAITKAERFRYKIGNHAEHVKGSERVYRHCSMKSLQAQNSYFDIFVCLEICMCHTYVVQRIFLTTLYGSSLQIKVPYPSHVHDKMDLKSVHRTTKIRFT